MDLNITIDGWGNKSHSGELFHGAADRVYAYQDESVLLKFSILGTNPRRADGVKNRESTTPEHDEYELLISRHTGKALSFTLRARRNDTVPQRIAQGFAVTHDILQTSLSFAEVCNRIFGAGASVFEEREAFPDSVKAAMKTAYH